jgi:oligoribonuclease
MNMKIAWIDVETTGLDPLAHELLEVYIIVTDENLEQLGTFVTYVFPDNENMEKFSVDEWMEFWDAIPREMHLKNGLVEDLKKTLVEGNAESCYGVQANLIDFFKRYNDGDPTSLYHAGSNVKFDISFLQHHTPLALRQVHYRSIDVSSTRVQMEAITGEDWAYPKEKGHRAHGDIVETIAEYKWLWTRFRDWVLQRPQMYARPTMAIDLWETENKDG